MSETQRLVQTLFIEAAAACGDDPLAIERYVRARLEEMSEEERNRFDGVAEEISAYKHNGTPQKDDH